MLKLYVLMNVYNDHVFLPVALSSVKHAADYLIVADGAYQQYYETYLKYMPDAKPWSTDGTREMLDIIPDLPPLKLIEPPDGEPWENQCVKRTAMLDAVPEGDWFIILDSDEMIHGRLADGMEQFMQSGCIAGNCPFYNAGLDVSQMMPMWHPRCYLKVEGMHYHRKHFIVLDYAGRNIYQTYPIKWTDAFVIAHLKAFKSGGRLLPHLSYMEKKSVDGWMEPYAVPKPLNLR